MPRRFVLVIATIIALSTASAFADAPPDKGIHGRAVVGGSLGFLGPYALAELGAEGTSFYVHASGAMRPTSDGELLRGFGGGADFVWGTVTGGFIGFNYVYLRAQGRPDAKAEFAELRVGLDTPKRGRVALRLWLGLGAFNVREDAGDGDHVESGPYASLNAGIGYRF